MTRPDLPATVGERIALARATIAGCLTSNDQLAPDYELVFGSTDLAVFSALAPSSERAIALCNTVVDALFTAGFGAVSHGVEGWPDRPECLCRIRVPVGSPAICSATGGALYGDDVRCELAEGHEGGHISHHGGELRW